MHDNRRWYARIVHGSERYGTWIPTGESDLRAAKDYIATYYRGPFFGAPGRIKEWLLL